METLRIFSRLRYVLESSCAPGMREVRHANPTCPIALWIFQTFVIERGLPIDLERVPLSRESTEFSYEIDSCASFVLSC